MKQHALTMDEACKEIKELTKDSWKFMIGQGLALKEYPVVVP
jgi:(S)-beta-macrocarpene synthase